MQEIETRSFRLTELRLAQDDSASPVIEGYAAVFNQLSEDLGGFRELIRPGAFRQTIQQDDIRALIQHDPARIIGRTKNGTLTLREDIHGLRVRIVPPDTSYARDLLESIRRGDIDQMSFGFVAQRDEWLIEQEQVTRMLLEVRLYDVSPVTFPAYPQTSVGVRAKVSELRQSLSATADRAQAGEGGGATQEQQALLDVLRKRIEIAERSLL